MHRWKPEISSAPTPPVQRWQSRAEIQKAHLDSLSPEELRRVRPDYYWLRFGHDAWKRAQARKYDPDQPRDDSGRWSDVGGGQETDRHPDFTAVQPAAYRLAALGKQSAAWCWNQMQIDMLYCASLYPAWRVAACRAQANERYGACLAGKKPPPLPF